MLKKLKIFFRITVKHSLNWYHIKLPIKIISQNETKGYVYIDPF